MYLNKNMLLIVLLFASSGLGACDEPAKCDDSRWTATEKTIAQYPSAYQPRLFQELAKTDGAVDQTSYVAAAGTFAKYLGGVATNSASKVMSTGASGLAYCGAGAAGRVVLDTAASTAQALARTAWVGAAAQTTVNIASKVPWDGLLVGAALIGGAIVKSEAERILLDAALDPEHKAQVYETMRQERLRKELKALEEGSDSKQPKG